jgi:hypothetical protein
MEFLMTYGWAILVVLVAISALAYFGIFTPSRFLPNTCTIAPGISCDEFVVYETSVIMILRNGLGEPITITDLRVDQCSGSAIGSMPDGKQETFTINGCVNAVGRVKKAINLTYTAGSGISHNINGLIVANVEGGIGNSDPLIICQNAQDAGLCNGLDIVYGAGYKANCFTSYGLCP